MCQSEDESGKVCNHCYRHHLRAPSSSSTAFTGRESTETSSFKTSSTMDASHHIAAQTPQGYTSNASTVAPVDIFVPSDTGWQKRGTGRNYNSLSGVGHIFGAETGKVLAVSIRMKQCRICDVAERMKKASRPHGCRKNWAQSAKSMEADTCVANVLAVNESNIGVRVSTVIGDEDSSAIHHLRSKVDATIEKWSDVNHVKKSLGNKLYDMKKGHPQMSETVIKSVQKNLPML